MIMSSGTVTESTNTIDTEADVYYNDKAIIHELNDEERARLCRIIGEVWIPGVLKVHYNAIQMSFHVWHTRTLLHRQHTQAMQEVDKVISILRTSEKKNRSFAEKDSLKKFISSYAKCLPVKDMSSSDLDILANEIDLYPVVGNSIIFLQGDFGNCYYVVALGAVALYLEASKDREMVIGREFGKLRGVPFSDPLTTLDKLGKIVVTLPRGAGFGEYAILSDTQKLRSCAAVSCQHDTLLLIMHAETYDKVLKRHHYVQRTLSSAIRLLQELPLFKALTYAKLSQVAYSMSSSIYASNSIVCSSGDRITQVMVVASGKVKVSLPKVHTSNNKKVSLQEQRLPQLCVAELGRGQIIGEIEIYKDCRIFDMNYVTCTSGCEIFKVPLAVYLDALRMTTAQNRRYLQQLKQNAKDKEEERTHRLNRTYNMLKKVMISDELQFDATASKLHTLLPDIIDVESITSKTNQFNGSIYNDTGGSEYMIMQQLQPQQLYNTTNVSKVGASITAPSKQRSSSLSPRKYY